MPRTDGEGGERDVASPDVGEFVAEDDVEDALAAAGGTEDRRGDDDEVVTGPAHRAG